MLLLINKLCGGFVFTSIMLKVSLYFTVNCINSKNKLKRTVEFRREYFYKFTIVLRNVLQIIFIFKEKKSEVWC